MMNQSSFGIWTGLTHCSYQTQILYIFTHWTSGRFHTLWLGSGNRNDRDRSRTQKWAIQQMVRKERPQQRKWSLQTEPCLEFWLMSVSPSPHPTTCPDPGCSLEALGSCGHRYTEKLWGPLLFPSRKYPSIVIIPPVKQAHLNKSTILFRGMDTKSSKHSLVIEKQQHDPREHVAKRIPISLVDCHSPASLGLRDLWLGSFWFSLIIFKSVRLTSVRLIFRSSVTSRKGQGRVKFRNLWVLLPLSFLPLSISVIQVWIWFAYLNC